MSEQASPTPDSHSPRQLGWQMAVATLSRFFLNVSRRFFYPFAPALSRGLGVPLTSITSLIAVNQATGLLSPFFGPLGDRWGYRPMLLAGMGMLSLGMLATSLLPFYATLLVAVFLAGLGKSIFDPALQAYVGQRVPYRRRGLVIGLIEFSWAGSTLIGIPLVGLLIDRWGWQAPFLALGGLGLVSTVALAIVIPPDGQGRQRAAYPPRIWEVWGQMSRDRAALGALGFIFLAGLANDNLFVVYGSWLEDRFALGVVAIGTATTVIGLAELLGEGLTASIADRLGLKRAVLIGLSLSSLSYALLPFIGRTLPLALGALFLTFLTFEFTIVTSFSLFTELLPRARAALLSSLMAATGIGRVAGALLGGPVWQAGGMAAVGLVSAAVSALALACLWWGLWQWRD